ncbi:MAG TPA: hypothetical protein VE861_04815, partial [Gemmatimonadaceae bacterium]|nr:hypothetical protein [Gemmatimonadaceae bacterium]
MPPSIPNVTIRRATPGDAAALAAFGRRTFRDTFAADNSEADMSLFLDATYGEAQQRSELADPALTCFVAISDGAIRASALLQSGTDAVGARSATV